MVFIIDDWLLRMLGISIPPFDMIWLMETLVDYAKTIREDELRKWIIDSLKECRLLYEINDITREEYERKSRELNQKLKGIERINRVNLEQRVNLLGNISKMG
jgi:uncharacterized membrane-anchored protein